MAETERRSGMSDYQEEVLTNLLDLQAELRGDEPEPHGPAARQAASETSRMRTSRTPQRRSP